MFAVDYQGPNQNVNVSDLPFSIVAFSDRMNGGMNQSRI